MGPFLIVFMVLQKFKTSTELNKMASIERDSKLQEGHGCLERIGSIEITRCPWAT